MWEEDPSGVEGGGGAGGRAILRTSALQLDATAGVMGVELLGRLHPGCWDCAAERGSRRRQDAGPPPQPAGALAVAPPEAAQQRPGASHRPRLGPGGPLLFRTFYSRRLGALARCHLLRVGPSVR